MNTASSAIASTVFTAVNGSIGSIKTIVEWVDKLENFVRQCGEAGETIRDIQELVIARKEDLQQWKLLWNIEATTKYSYQRELWGDNQLRVIRGKISAIEDICSKFNDKFKEFFSNTQMSQLLQNATAKNYPISILHSQEAFRKDAKEKVQNASAWQIILFIRNIKPQAMDWLSRLKTMLAELSETANKAFSAKHREKVSDGLTIEQLEKVERSTFLRMAVGLRQGSEELFRLCLQANEYVTQETKALHSAAAHTWIKLDMTGIRSGIDLKNIPSQRGVRLLYHLILKWEESAEEICIEGPLPDPNEARNLGSFIEAYKAVKRNEEATILIEPNDYFPSREPKKTETILQRNFPTTIQTQQSLVDILHSLDEPDSDEFPRTQRLFLAFKISECGLFLAGTSWLSKLRSRYVRCPQVGRCTYHFILDADKSPQKASWQSFDQLAISMFRIGIVLIELGIGELVCNVRLNRVSGVLKRNEEFLLCKPGLDHTKYGKYTSLAAIIDMLNTTMGGVYASATAHCLGTMRDKCGEAASTCFQGDIYEKFQKIFNDYFISVYTPLDELARKVHWEDRHMQEILAATFWE